MYIPKKYGESKVDKCPFCGLQATTENSQGIPVCVAHRGTLLDQLKCMCGRFLDVKKGKFGAYLNCINCGNLNMKKAMELNDGPKYKLNKSFQEKETKVREKPQPKEIFVRSDDPRYFD